MLVHQTGNLKFLHWISKLPTRIDPRFRQRLRQPRTNPPEPAPSVHRGVWEIGVQIENPLTALTPQRVRSKMADKPQGVINELTSIPHTLETMVEQAQSLEEVRKRDLYCGDRVLVTVTTRNSLYTIWVLGDGRYRV